MRKNVFDGSWKHLACWKQNTGVDTVLACSSRAFLMFSPLGYNVSVQLSFLGSLVKWKWIHPE